MAQTPDESERRDDLDDGENSDIRNTAQREKHSIDLTKCPYCGKYCVAVADVCPHCHSFVHIGLARHYPWWVWVGIVGAVAAAAMWVVPF